MVTSVRSEIMQALRDGEFRRRLMAYCLGWRTSKSHFALANIVRYAVDCHSSNDLYSTVTDPAFRERRRTLTGINSLRADLDMALSFFAKSNPDVLRYLKILTLTETSRKSDEFRFHKQRRRQYEKFLQLDVPSQERHNVGLHKVVTSSFPVNLGEAQAGTKNQADLLGYELGDWRCLCGAVCDPSQRFDFACECRLVNGNGRIPRRVAPCTKCGRRPTYQTCATCDTRVTLDLVWRMRQGNVHPSDLRIPLRLRLERTSVGKRKKQVTTLLMTIPVMLGIEEIEGRIVMGAPAFFWAEAAADDYGMRSTTGQFVTFADRHDPSMGLLRALEDTLREVLHSEQDYFASNLLEVVSAAFRGTVARRRICATDTTNAFEDRLANQLCAHVQRSNDLVRFVDSSYDCVVAMSGNLQGDEALLNRKLLRPGAMNTPQLLNATAVIRKNELGGERLTPEPPRIRPSRCSALAADGVVRPGHLIQPGQLLVGISAPVDPADLTPEERLLHAIFGEQAEYRRSVSLHYDGHRPARVLATHIRASTNAGLRIRRLPGRSFGTDRGLGSDEVGHITITLATEQPVETGDVLFDPKGSRVVICGFRTGAMLREQSNTSIEPDLLVGSGHPWAPPNGRVQIVPVSPDAGALVGNLVQARATGRATQFRLQPETFSTNGAQQLDPQHFEWLLKQGARHLAFELLAPRGDCLSWAIHLYAILAKRGSARLSDVCSAAPAAWTSPITAPSARVRDLAHLLRAAHILVDVTAKRLSLRMMSDGEIKAISNGEVTEPFMSEIQDNLRTHRPVSGGLLCSKIFGDEMDTTCLCFTLRDGWEDCPACGAPPRFAERRRLAGHIDLAVPVVHPWLLRAPGGVVAETLGLTEDELWAIVDFGGGIFVDSSTDRGVVFQRSNEWWSGDPDSGQRFLFGAEAIEFLCSNPRSRAKVPRVNTNGLVMRRLLVLPAELRPQVVERSGHIRTSDLNLAYAKIIRINRSLRRLIDVGGPASVVSMSAHRLQNAVWELFDNDRCTAPARAREGRGSRNRTSLAHFLKLHASAGGSLRDGLLSRSVDFSARTALVVGGTEDVDTVLLPDRLAWKLFLPILLSSLVSSHVAHNLRAAQEQVRDRSEKASAILRREAQNALIVVVSPGSEPPIFAARVRLTAELGLHVHPDVLKRIGVEQLGGVVRVFSVLTEEARKEAVKLLPSVLSNRTRREVVSVDAGSLFDVSREQLIDTVAVAAWRTGTFPLVAQDVLAMARTEWLGGT